ncbi:hypothetical protein BS47DRAFT_1355332 [Hydnum rufescens UP504]|uniref:Uncharacterized protein n=1 Tax=Hydnum rufescens UP504 TaxID=1448309 RepID=A0A9P6AEN0_9AGAM|nr:hypothetical protein BS47DRAFT_1355332 [Hydnum rufescens UP504]
MEVTQRPKHVYITYVCLDYSCIYFAVFIRSARLVLRKITAYQDARGLGLEDVFPIEEQGCTGAKGVSRTNEAIK